MGILHMNTADVGDTTLFQSTSGDFIVSALQARTGTKSFRSDNLGIAVIPILSRATGYGRICTYVGGSYVGNNNWAINLKEGNTIHLDLRANQTAGYVQLHRGTSLIASESDNVPGENVWVAWEFYWDIHDSTGVFTLKANGTQVMHFSGDTRNSGLGVINNIVFGGVQLSSAMCYPTYFDDIIIRDDQWPMRGGIHVLTPNADGDTVSWTKSDALKGYHEHINTQPPDYTDYLETDATVAATKQLTHLTTLADDVWNIRGAGTYVNCKSTVSTDAFVRTLLLPADIGAAQAVGSDFGVESAAAWAKTYYEENPHDSAAWEKADIDDLQIGVETRVPA